MTERHIIRNEIIWLLAQCYAAFPEPDGHLEASVIDWCVEDVRKQHPDYPAADFEAAIEWVIEDGVIKEASYEIGTVDEEQHYVAQLAGEVNEIKNYLLERKMGVVARK